MISRLVKGSKGFTLMELMVVVGILGVLMAIIAPAVSGTKSSSVEGQVVSDAQATQTAVDNFSNKSVNSGQFPELPPTDTLHKYHDVYLVGGTGGNAGTGENVFLLDKFGVAVPDQNGAASTLATKWQPSGTTGSGDQVYQRRFFNFDATTIIYDADGSTKTAGFVPDFLNKYPSSLPLKGDETADLGATLNTIEEYLWLLLVNAGGTSQESRVVQVFRLTGATFTDTSPDATSDIATLTYTQVH